MGSRGQFVAFIGSILLCCLLLPLAKLNAQAFGPCVKYGTSYNSPRRLLIKDLNNDGRRDIAVICGAGTAVEIFYQYHDGSFHHDNAFTAGTNLSAMAAADFDGDGYAEIAVTDQSLNVIKIYYYNGLYYLLRQTINCPGQPYDIYTNYLDGGPTYDLFVACIGDNSVKFYRGNGDGTFNTSYQSHYAPSPARVLYLYHTPFRIAVPSYYADSVALYQVLYSGAILYDSTYFTGGGSRAGTSGVFLNDGQSYRDLALVCRTDSTIKILGNDHNDHFYIAEIFNSEGVVPYDVASGDFYHDTMEDLAIIDNRSDGKLWIANQNGAWYYTFLNGIGLGPRSIATDDLNNDSYLDLVISFANEDSIGIFYNQLGNLPSCQYTPGDANGNGSFNGLDVSYGVTYFKGGPPPPYTCDCPPHGTWFVTGDVNASCSYNGLDVTYAVSYFKGGPPPHPCADCPPAGR